MPWLSNARILIVAIEHAIVDLPGVVRDKSSNPHAANLSNMIQVVLKRSARKVLRIALVADESTDLIGPEVLGLVAPPRVAVEPALHILSSLDVVGGWQLVATVLAVRVGFVVSLDE